MKNRFLKKFLIGSLLVALPFGLVACKTTGSSNNPTPDITANSAAIDNTVVASINDASCPQVEVLDGTGVLTAYSGDGAEEPGNVDHQATLIQFERQCAVAGDTFTLSVEAAGRAAKGPKSISDNVTLPIRIAVTDTSGAVLYSKLYNQLVELQINQPKVFKIRDNDIRVPLDLKDNIKILIGFDTIGIDQASAEQSNTPAG